MLGAAAQGGARWECELASLLAGEALAAASRATDGGPTTPGGAQAALASSTYVLLVRAGAVFNFSFRAGHVVSVLLRAE